MFEMFATLGTLTGQKGSMKKKIRPGLVLKLTSVQETETPALWNWTIRLMALELWNNFVLMYGSVPYLPLEGVIKASLFPVYIKNGQSTAWIKGCQWSIRICGIEEYFPAILVSDFSLHHLGVSCFLFVGKISKLSSAFSSWLLIINEKTMLASLPMLPFLCWPEIIGHSAPRAAQWFDIKGNGAIVLTLA